MNFAINELGLASGYTQEEVSEAIERKGKYGEGSANPLGFDFNYCLQFFHGNGSYANCPIRPIATVQNKESGRILRVASTTPGVQLYTGNYIKQCPGKEGALYQQRAGLCLETQNYPSSISADANSFPDFAKGQCFILRPNGRPYFHDVVYTFETSDFP